ncbi:MAG TPA: hypothetical protein VNW06_10625 [Cytophagaceae bacterium]|jgi:hypothetical protein|nr:hypothetical protein [Cytophagaceae bacterium]
MIKQAETVKVNKASGNVIKLSKNHELITTSFHEAGHALCGLLFYMEIPSVVVKTSKVHVSGYTHYNMINDLNIKDLDIWAYLLFSEIYISYAGLAAEKIFYKDISGSDKFPMVLKDGSSPDILDASKIIKKFNLASPGKKRNALKKKLFNKITRILKDNWDDLKLIAHTLFKCRKLYHNDIKKLLTKKSKNKVYWKQQFKDINYLFNAPQPLDDKDIGYILRK